MPAKIARLATRPPFWIPEVSVAVRSSRPSCGKAEKREYSWRSAVIRGIPVETLAQAARPVDDDWGSDRQVEAENLFFDAVCRELSNEQIIELEEPIRTETDPA